MSERPFTRSQEGLEVALLPEALAGIIELQNRAPNKSADDALTECLQRSQHSDLVYQHQCQHKEID